MRLATVDAPGDFDTHDNQPEELAKSLGEVSAALSAFQADLEARGVADRVVTLVWSEFGRRPEANDSKGTDHGAGGLAWVQGTRVRSGVLSDYPDLGRLDDDGNLAVTLDFRRVYSSLIEQWLRHRRLRSDPERARVRPRGARAMRLRALLVALLAASALLSAGAAQARAPVAVGVGLRSSACRSTARSSSRASSSSTSNNRGEDVHDIAVKRGKAS